LMPIPRKKATTPKRGWRKSGWKPEYLPAALLLFAPFDPCKGFPKGVYHCCKQEDITAEEVVNRKGGSQ
jgi:hypothetical protein